MRSFGVFFLQFQQRFQANASEVAFMSFIQNIVVSVTGETCFSSFTFRLPIKASIDDAPST